MTKSKAFASVTDHIDLSGRTVWVTGPDRSDRRNSSGSAGRLEKIPDPGMSMVMTCSWR
jgi:hypothetical protein